MFFLRGALRKGSRSDPGASLRTEEAALMVENQGRGPGFVETSGGRIFLPTVKLSAPEDKEVDAEFMYTVKWK